MANVIKYSTTKPSQSSLRKGNLAVGVGDDNYGPTSTTGFVNGMDIPNGGYVVYLLHNNSPAAYVAYNDTDLIAVARTLGNSGTTVTSAKEYLAGRSDTWILNNTPPNIVTDDLILNLDASDVSSYPTAGTTWYDISGADNNGAMINGLSFNSGGWMDFDGADDSVSIPNNNGTMDAWNEQQTIIVWEYHDFTTGRRNIWNQAYGGFGTWTHEQGGSVNYYFGDAGANAQPYVSANSSTTVGGQWNMLCVTRDLTTVNWYQNGVLTSTRGNPYGELTNTTAGVTIGTGYTGTRWQGKMAKILAYTKALTQSEILQNYYQAPIVTDGLVFAIDAGNLVSYENGDTIANSLVVTLPGDLNNGVGFDSNNGGNWVFDGADDYITLPDTIAIALNGGTEASLNMWVKLNNNSNGSGQSGIIQLSNFNSSNGNLYWYSNGYTYLDIFRTNRVAKVWANTVIDPRNWHMLTVTTTPGTNGWKAYLNGILQKQVTGQSTVSVNSTIQGGLALGRNSTGRDLPGNIASCFIYDKALTEEEVTQNYNAQVSRF
tara:strand:- start:984 stop:2615 length:1632 start_codon:yes stop_codon:yes gene_type:complete